MKSILPRPRADERDQRRRSLDQVGHILHSSYGVDYWRGWKDLLGANYQYALQILLQSKTRFKGNPSGWLASQNSFNDAVFKAFHGFLKEKDLPGTMALKFADGRYKNFGTFVAVDCAFGIAMPVIAAGMRVANERRNKIPDSHPYDLKTRKQNRYLGNRERDDLKAQLSTVYSEIITFVSLPRP
jgi:hypothetical protein